MDYDEFAFGDELDKKASSLLSAATGLVVAGVRYYRVDGACPRCGHRVVQSGVLDLLLPSVPDRPFGVLPPSDAATTGEVPLRCSCNFPHRGAPDSVKGCGAEFIVTVVFEPSKEEP